MKKDKVVTGTNESLSGLEHILGWVIFGVIMGNIASCLTGCGGTAGWRFEVGVAPVTAIHDTASLTDRAGVKHGE